MNNPTPTPIVFKPTAQPPQCQKCGYSLRGLTTPRCPECGKAFDPADSHTYTRTSPLPPWNRSEWILGCAAAILVGLAVPASILLIARHFEPLVFLFLTPPITTLVITGFFCNMRRTLGWSTLASLVSILILLAIFFAPRVHPEGLVWVLLGSIIATGILVPLAGVMLFIGHAFRRWGPFEWGRKHA